MRRLFRTERACDGHHVIAADDLRAGTVKARRSRVWAVGAKRRALHGAEHRCSIVVVMADGVDVMPDFDHLATGRKSTSNATRASHHLAGQRLAGKHART
jgi:hypothetical protein